MSRTALALAVVLWAAPQEPKNAPLARTPAGYMPGRFLITPDGKKIVVPSSKEAKLLIWNLPSLDGQAVVALPHFATSVTLLPDGNEVVAVGGKTVMGISLSQLKVTRTFAVAMNVQGLCAVNADIVLACSQDSVLAISLSKQSVVKTMRGASGGLIHGSSAYGIPVHGGTVLVEQGRPGEPIDFALSYGGMEGRGPWDLSPDGRYLTSGTEGLVFRMGRTTHACKVPMTKLDPFDAAAFSPDGSKLCVINDGGALLVYETQGFTVKHTIPLGIKASQVSFDTADTIVVLGATLVPRGSRPQPRDEDLIRFKVP